MNDTVSTHDSDFDPRNSTIKIHINGELFPRDEAKVSVYDSGFMLGDGVWEGLRLHDGVVVFLDEHLDRLFEGAKMLDLDIGKTKQQLSDAVYELLAANEMVDDVHLRLMVTRGPKRVPFQDPRLSKDGPTIAIIAEHSKVSVDAVKQGIKLHTVHVYRAAPVTQDPRLNSHSKLNCILALIQALKANAEEALMLDPQGFVNTTNSTNFFIVRKGEVWTSTGDYCMNGITRQKVIDLCKANDIPVYEKNFSLVDVYSADEAFVTGTFGAQTPVREIDGRIIGTGDAGPVFWELRKLYADLLHKNVEATKAL